MLAQTIRNNYDNYLISRDVSLKEMLEHPVALPKDQVPLWQFYSVSKPYRSMDNYLFIHALLLDYDSGEPTIDEFIKQYGEYSFALYTTSSHSASRNKYRVILPLDNAYEYEQFRSKYMKCSLLGFFTGVDASCFHNFHKIPALPANPADYRYHINQGKRFSLSMFESKIKEMEFDDQLVGASSVAHRKTITLTDESKQKYHDIVLESLQRKYGGCGSSQTGHRYSDLCSYAGALCNAKDKLTDDWVFNKIEIEQLIKCEYWDTAIAKMVRAFLSRRKY